MDIQSQNSPQHSIHEDDEIQEEANPKGPTEQQPFLVTDLNFENDVDYDNLEKHLDQNFNVENDEKFQNELLFAVQGLGGVKKFNNLEIYIKSQDCEESLKELVRILKRDDPDHPFARLELSKWNILVSDLIPLILTQPQDKKLSFYVILLTVQMTEFPSQSCYKGDFLVSSLQRSKLAFLQANVVKTLMIHLADCMSVEAQNRTKIHENMIELIITLIRNLVRIPDLEEARHSVNEFKRNMQFNLLLIFEKDSVFDALIFLCQDMTSPLLRKLNLAFLEIFYHIFSSFKPKWIMSCSEDDRKRLEELEDSAKRQQIKRMNELGTRHSRFGTNLCIKRLLGGGFKVLSNPFKVNEEINKIQNQRIKPIMRKFGAKFPDIYKKSLHEDMKIHGMEESLGEEVKSFKLIIRNFALDFLEHAYGNLLESLYDEIYKDSERIQENDVINYFVVMEFGLGLARHRYYLQRKEKQMAKENANSVNLDIEPIIQALQLTQFELVYSHLVREVTRPKKKMVQYRLYYAAIAVLLEILYITQELSLSTDSILRKNSQSLMQNIFHHDITRIIRVGFVFCVPGLLNDNLLKTLIEIQMIFFDLLESFSKGKVLTIQTDKRIKRKKEAAKKKKVKGDNEELNDFIEKDPNEGEEGDEEYDPLKKEHAKLTQDNEETKEGEEDDSEDEDDENLENQPLYQERKFNFMSEFAMIADYGVMTKMFWMIKDNLLLTNDKQLNLSVFKYLKKIFDLMKADWMFFQIDYLNVFHQIISNSEIRNKLEYRNYIDLIRKILRNFFNLLQKNKFLLVESLFRFTDKSIKDSILSNYENDPEMFSTHDPQKLFEDDDDLDVKHPRNQSKTWYKIEDQTLIQNYDQFKDLPNCEDHLCLLINNMGFSDKEPIDVRRRIKFLKLNKGQEKAKELFNEIYENQRLSFNLVVKNFLENCKQEKLTKEDLIIFLQEKFEKFKEFKKILNLSSSETVGSAVVDFILVPIQAKDFDVLESPLVHQIFLSLELRAPGQGEWMWRIPGYFTVNDVENLFDKLKIGLESGIVENEPDGGLLPMPRMRPEFRMEREENKEDDNDLNYGEEENKDDEFKETLEEENEVVNELNGNDGDKENEDLDENYNNNKNDDVELNENNENENAGTNENQENEQIVETQSNQNKNRDNNEEEEERKIVNEDDDDEGETFFEIDENPKKVKKEDIKWESTVPLATLEGFVDEVKNNNLESKNKWIDQTLVVPTLNPEEN